MAKILQTNSLVISSLKSNINEKIVKLISPVTVQFFGNYLNGTVQ